MPVADKFLDINPQLQNFTSLTATVPIDNSGSLLALPEIISQIEQITQDSQRQIAIVPFKPSAKVEVICRQHSWLLVANPTKVSRLIEDKLRFSQLCELHHLPQIPHLLGNYTPDSFAHAQKEFGDQLVVQTRLGWAGKSTYIIDSYHNQQIIPHTPVKYMPFLKGYTLINNCCLYQHHLLQSPPGLQYNGVPRLCPNPFSTVGRQWPSFTPTAVITQVHDLTTKVAAILDKSFQYRGFFGLDFFVDTHDQVYLLECNPRLTASYAFYTDLELRLDLNPLFYFHLASFLDLNFDFDWASESSRFSNPDIIGSEVVKKDEFSNTTQRLHFSTALVSAPFPIKLPAKVIDSFR